MIPRAKDERAVGRGLITKSLVNCKSLKNLDFIIRASGELLKRLKFMKGINLELLQPNCKEWNGVRKLEGEVLIIQMRDESCLYYVNGNKNGKKWMNLKDNHHWSFCYQKLLDVKRPMFRRLHRKAKSS